jgi:hypothetical protein
MNIKPEGRLEMIGRTRSPTRLVVAVAAILSLTGAVSSVSAAPAQGRALKMTKDCSGSTGRAGFFCTIRSSNVKPIKAGARIFYFQANRPTQLNSDVVLYAGRGNTAAGHCVLHFATGRGLCTFSDGTGTLAGFKARARVSADSKIPNLFHWEGTYSFSR